MARETGPGLKILWLWTFGTAAVLVTSVVRTRMQDMEKLVNADPDHHPPQHRSDAVLLDPYSEQPDQALRDDVQV